VRTSDIRIGVAALEARTAPSPAEPVGHLSGPEAALLPRNAQWFEEETSWLYFHLTCASESRGRMARLDEDSQDYRIERESRTASLDAARRHLDALRVERWKPDGVLAAMILVEGL
jgi:hypothetical protein